MSDKENRIWSKNKKSQLDKKVHGYVFSRTLSSDSKLLEYDLIASIAHARMLSSIGVLSKDEFNLIEKGLLDISDKHKKGEFNIIGFEDMHSAIESCLTELYGDIGKKIHTGRSRNDQVLTAMRMFTVAELKKAISLACSLSESIASFATENEFLPMPGLTHFQFAMPSSVGQWASSFLESILNDIEIIENAIHINNQNPLGSAAGFGTMIPIDREMTTKEIGFDRIQSNSLFCQNSRGKFELYTVFCMHQMMMTLSKIANDLITFCSQGFDFFTLSDSIVTGSSIMPQKRNPDVLEVVRANCSKILGYAMQLGNTSHNLISGYNKDLKFTKDVMIESFDILQSSLEVMAIVFQNIEVNEGPIRALFKKQMDIFAADEANRLVVEKNIPFRDAYNTVGASKDIKNIDIDKNLKSKKHIGATGNLQISETLSKILSKAKHL